MEEARELQEPIIITRAIPVGTAIISINPGVDPAVVQLKERAEGLLRFALARVVATDADVRTATEDLSLVSTLKKAIEAKRTEYTGPINAHLKAVNEAFKLLTDPLTQADVTTRLQIKNYRLEQEEKARKAEEINRLRMEAARKEMELKGEITEPINEVAVPPPQPAHVYTDVGTLGTAKIWKFEVMDPLLVPRDYLAVDMVKIGQVVRATKGTVTIAGVRIYPEDTVRITAR